MASYDYAGYPETPAPGFYTAAGKVFIGGFPYTLVSSSTSEQAFMFRNAAASGVQARLVGFRATCATLPTAGTATAAVIRFYTVEAITGGSGTSATGKNMLLGGAASVCTYHTSATSTATATTLLPIALEVSAISGSGSLDILATNPIIVPEGYILMAMVEGPAGIVPVINLTAVWIEDAV